MFALVDDDKFASLNKWKWYASKSPTGDSFYALRSTYSKLSEGGNGARGHVRMHHEILPKKKGKFIDHIDGNGLNNRAANLRYATKSQNGMNRGLTSKNTTGYKGVHFYKSRGNYTANIAVNGKLKCIGYFETAEEAHKAYKKAAKKLHGEFAKW